MSGYCTATDLILVCNANEQIALGDDNGTGTGGTGIQQGAIDRASFDLYGLLHPRYQDLASPDVYVAGTHRGLEFRAASLALAYLRERQGGPVVPEDHPSRVWAGRIALFLSDLS